MNVLIVHADADDRTAEQLLVEIAAMPGVSRVERYQAEEVALNVRYRNLAAGASRGESA